MDTEAFVGDAAVGADYDDDFDDESSSDDDGTLPADRYLDRELSWLAYNQRVLEQAENPGAVDIIEVIELEEEPAFDDTAAEDEAVDD